MVALRETVGATVGEEVELEGFWAEVLREWLVVEGFWADGHVEVRVVREAMAVAGLRDIVVLEVVRMSVSWVFEEILVICAPVGSSSSSESKAVMSAADLFCAGRIESLGRRTGGRNWLEVDGRRD